MHTYEPQTSENDTDETSEPQTQANLLDEEQRATLQSDDLSKLSLQEYQRRKLEL